MSTILQDHRQFLQELVVFDTDKISIKSLNLVI